ncbi:MAG TPA: hypothetical protein PKD00_07455 [Burkholderiales bacterium]|nr:hypothetical protein [Burkholderiales bacterium]
MMSKKLLITILASSIFTTIANAKEITLKLKKNSLLQMDIYYKITNAKNANDVYAQGNITLTKNFETEFIYVNKIPADADVLVQIDKMHVYSRTVFNDPCEIILNKNDLTANITVGFKGDPKSHGSFTCMASKG